MRPPWACRTLGPVPQDIDPISQLPDDAQLLKQQLRVSANEVQRLQLMVDKLKLQLARWKALTRYVDDGRIKIDNSAAELALRCVALGRGNYLFMGSNTGGERAASMYSLIETAKLNGLDPEAYLRELLQRIADHPVNRIDELLPWNIGSERADAEMRTAA